MVVFTDHVQLLAFSHGELSFILLGNTTAFNIDLEQLKTDKPLLIEKYPLEDQVLMKEEFGGFIFVVYIKNQDVIITKMSPTPNLAFQKSETSLDIKFESFSDIISFRQTGETSFSLFDQKGVYLFSIHDIVTQNAPEHIHPLDLGLTTIEYRYLLIGKVNYKEFYSFVIYDLFRKELVFRNVVFRVMSNEANLQYSLISPEVLEISSGNERITLEFKKVSLNGKKVFDFYELAAHRNRHLLGVLSINGSTFYLHNRTDGTYLTKGNAAKITGFRPKLKLKFLGENLYIFGRCTHYAYKASGNYDYLYMENFLGPVSKFSRPIKSQLFRRYGYFKVPVSKLELNSGTSKLYLGNKDSPMHILKLKPGNSKAKLLTFKKMGDHVITISNSSRGSLSTALTSETEEFKFTKRLTKKAITLKESKMVLRLIRILFTIIGRFPKMQKMVIFESFHAKQYSDNPRAIYEYMKEHYPDYKLLWSVNKQAEALFDRFQVPYVRRFTFRWFLTFPRAKYWVNNVRLPAWMPKPQNTIFVQTWHGTPLKKLGLDIEEIHMPGTKTSTYKKNFVIESSKWDYLVSPNAYSTEIFKRAFHFSGKVIESGYPRNDALSNATPAMIHMLKKRLGIPDEKKIMLYAPTWRDNEFYQKGKYKFEFQFNLDNWKREFGDEWVLLSRMHYLVAENFDFSAHTGMVYDVSSYPDIRDLYLISDLMITDYSSVFFDYSILNRPIIFFMYDLEKYRNELRGFYINIEEEAPGPIVQTEDELFGALHELMHSDVQLNPKFIAFKDNYASLEDGYAAKRVVQTFLE